MSLLMSSCFKNKSTSNILPLISQQKGDDLPLSITCFVVDYKVPHNFTTLLFVSDITFSPKRRQNLSQQTLQENLCHCVLFVDQVFSDHTGLVSRSSRWTTPVRSSSPVGRGRRRLSVTTSKIESHFTFYELYSKKKVNYWVDIRWDGQNREVLGP